MNFSKLLTAALALMISNAAFAIPNGEYNCTIYPKGKNKKPVEFSFKVKKDDVLCQKENDGNCEQWFTFKPKKNDFFLDGLLDGKSYSKDNGDWAVDADNDGCDNGHLVLYKDSKFTKGFITSKFSCSDSENKSFAGDVTCE